jgi:hypothetical protein
MRLHTEFLPDILRDSFNRRLIADVFHGTERVASGVDLTSWTFEGDLNSDVKHSGAATIVHNSVKGESWVPQGTDGILSPFRARLLLQLEITAGVFTETIVLGWVRVTSIPQAYDVIADVNGAEVVSSSVVEVRFQSLEVDVRRHGFHFPEQPRPGASGWDEVRRIGGMPVVESLPDKTLPSSLTYEAKEGGRLEGVQRVIAELGGIAVVNPAGAWTAVPQTPGTPVEGLYLGPQGTVMDVPYSVDTDGVYTTVIGTYEQEDREPLTSVKSASLAGGLFPEYTRYRSNPLVKTQAQADADAQSILDNSVRSQQYEVDVQCIINPLIELGDVIPVNGWVRPLQGRVLSYRMSDSALMNVKIEASRELS